MTHDRRLIEDSLPLEAISFQSAREKSIRHGHISTLHIWWARRPLAAMRAAIFASLIPAPKDEAERARLHTLIGGTYNPEKGVWEGGICDWDSVKDGDSPVIDEARRLIAAQYPDAPPKVLDPFMGGGSTGLEALRLGCEAHGVELNPVAYLIELCTLVYPQKYGQPIPRSEYEAARPWLQEAHAAADGGAGTQQAMPLDADELVNPLAEDIRYWGNWVLEHSKSQVGHLYSDSEGNDVLAYFWAKTAICPNPTCQATMPLIGQYWLVKRDKTKIAVKPQVSTSEKLISFEIISANEADFDISAGTMKRSSASCLVCEQSCSAEYLQESQIASDRSHDQLMAIVLNRKEGGRNYRGVELHDQEIYQEALARWQDTLELTDSTGMSALPFEEFPYLRSIFNIHVYGARTWADLFNPRQAVTLVSLAQSVQAAIAQINEEGIEAEYRTALATYLGVLFDRVLVRMTAYNIWDSTTESVMQIFNQGQSLPMRWDYVEVNPFSTAGGGSWSNSIDYICLVVEHTSKTSSAGAALHAGTALRLPYSDSLIHAVVTDPPYYDSVPYADLSDFFYVWLRRNLADEHSSVFYTPLTPKMEEIVQLAERNERYSHKDKQHYELQLKQAFTEAARTLESNGIFTTVFAHKSTAAWEAAINALLEASLVITASWPLHTESRNRLRAKDSAALASSIFIVCRKRTAFADGLFDDVRAELRDSVRDRLDFFWSQGIRGADFFISAIGPAVAVFGQYRQVRKLTGEVVTAAELLDLVQEMVSDYALAKVMNGRYRMGAVDATTRFYVMYRWSYGNQKIPADDARRLAQALGAEVDELIHRRELLKQSGEDVTLRGPLERDNEHLGEVGRDGMNAPLVDVVHRAVLLWRANDRRALAEFLAANAQGREDSVRAVAQAIASILPEGDREKQLLEGFLSGQDSLPSVPRQERLL